MRANNTATPALAVTDDCFRLVAHARTRGRCTSSHATKFKVRSQRKRRTRQRTESSLERRRCDRPLTTARIRSIVLPTGAFCAWRDVVQLEFLNRTYETAAELSRRVVYFESEGVNTQVRYYRKLARCKTWKLMMQTLKEGRFTRYTREHGKGTASIKTRSGRLSASPRTKCPRARVGNYTVPAGDETAANDERARIHTVSSLFRILLPTPVC
jgi:hypothetical protein